MGVTDPVLVKLVGEFASLQQQKETDGIYGEGEPAAGTADGAEP